MSSKIFIAFALAYFFSYALRTINAVISPDLTVEFHLTATQLGLLTSVYLLSFTAFQLPLGILLDRYGPRRVESFLVAIAALGVAIFAIAENYQFLLLGRFLIGLGVSACLMAAIKGFSMWWPLDKQANVVAWIMTFGMLGAVSSSTPFALLIKVMPWRTVFFIIAAILFLVAALLWYFLPETKVKDVQSVRQQIAAIRQIIVHRRFLWVSLPAGFGMGTFIGIQGLWAIPWLMTQFSYTRDSAAEVIFVMNITLLIGTILLGSFSQRLAKIGISPWHSFLIGLSISVIALLSISLRLPLNNYLLWGLLGFGFASNMYCYLQVIDAFPANLAGRVSTSVNLIMFACAFLSQWLIGVIIDFLQLFNFSYAWSMQISFIIFALLFVFSYLQYALRFRQFYQLSQEKLQQTGQN